MDQATIDAPAKRVTAPASLDEAWDRFKELGKREAFDELNELFRQGKPPKDLDGPTDGILVVPTMGSIRTPAVKAISSVWMPWLGKRFFSSESRGDNRFRQSVRLPAKLLWPSYSTRPNGNERTAFDFETRIEPGGHDPDVKVLVIDYAPCKQNPDRLIRDIRDELVEVAPGAFLGKILVREDDGYYGSLGYFALRRST